MHDTQARVITRKRYPALAAFDRGDELMLWIWTYRVWSGWRWPKMPLGMRAVPQ